MTWAHVTLGSNPSAPTNMSFVKNKEDFVCDNCGVFNKGDGYTNHCYKCLFSKHVDVDPGDRSNTCLGLMKPAFVSYTNSDQYILHECLRCGFRKKNRISNNDSLETLIRVQKDLE